MLAFYTRWGYYLGLNIAISCLYIFCPNSASAQITPDNTLPTNSNVSNQGNTSIITGGTQAGNNLFHSFKEFSVNTGKTVEFNNAAEIQNIITRVTGEKISNIDGLIKTQSPANLFLINPNGIIFGKNAQLNVGGNFVATTASTIGFGDRGFFSATDPNSPALLTVNPSALLFNQINQAQIQSNKADLGVPQGQSLLLVGGDININGGNLNAPGGRVELGSVNSGSVELSASGNQLRLGFADNLIGAQVLMSNNSKIDVAVYPNGDSGNINISARDISLTNGTVLRTSAFGKGKAGDIRIQAGTLSLESKAELNAANYGEDDAGNVLIEARDRVSLNSDSSVSVDTTKVGEVGSVFINAHTATVTLDNSNIFSRVLGKGEANAGKISINAKELSLTNGAELNAISKGKNSASVIIDASDRVWLDGSNSSINTGLQENARGKAGNIDIKTGTLSISNQAQLNTATRAKGNAGDVIIEARDRVSFDKGNVFAGVGENGTGKGGNVQITSQGGDVSLTNGSFITLSSSGQGDAGNAKVKARSLSLASGSLLTASTHGNKEAGTIDINTTDYVKLSGANPVGRSTTEISTDTLGTGDGNSITIDTNEFQISDGAIINARTTESGNGGNITINSKTFSATNGGQVLTTTSGKGQAGNINVNTTDSITIAQKDQTFNARKDKWPGEQFPNVDAASGIFANTTDGSTGSGGNIEVNSNNLVTISDGGKIAVDSNGSGNAGNINIGGRFLKLNNQGLISAETTTASGGIITLDLQRLLQMRQTSNISTSASRPSGSANTSQNSGNAGNIDIETQFLVALPRENSDIKATSDDKNGGNVTIDAINVIGIQKRDPESDASDIIVTGKLSSGKVDIKTPDIDPTQSLVELTVNVVDPSQQLATDCKPNNRYKQNSFIATGRGGLPISSTEPLQDINTLDSWVNLRQSTQNIQPQPTTVATTTPVSSIVEASGWVVDASGNIQLVNNVDVGSRQQVNPGSRWFEFGSCAAVGG